MAVANDRKKIFEQAKKAIIENDLYTIEEIVAFLPIVKKTFYEYFPIDSNESNEIKELIDQNKIKIKSELRKTWREKSKENMTAGIMLYKLLGTKDERMALSNQVEEVRNETEDKKKNTFDLFPKIDD